MEIVFWIRNPYLGSIQSRESSFLKIWQCNARNIFKKLRKISYTNNHLQEVWYVGADLGKTPVLYPLSSARWYSKSYNLWNCIGLLTAKNLKDTTILCTSIRWWHDTFKRSPQMPSHGSLVQILKEIVL